MQESESFEVGATAAGNTVLGARASEHHADVAGADAIVLHLSNDAPGVIAVGRLAGLSRPMCSRMESAGAGIRVPFCPVLRPL